MILTIALGIVLGGILLVLLPILLPALLILLIVIVGLIFAIIIIAAISPLFITLCAELNFPVDQALWSLFGLTLLVIGFYYYRKPITAWMIPLYTKLPLSQLKKIYPRLATMLAYTFCIIAVLAVGHYLLKSAIANIVIKPNTFGEDQQKFDPVKDWVPVDSEVDVPTKYIKFPKIRYVLSIGKGCTSCHYNHLQAFDELGRELFNTDTSDASFDVAFADSFSIKEPIRTDNEPLCCPSSFQRRYFQFDKKKSAFVERKPWWGFFLEEVGYYEN